MTLPRSHPVLSSPMRFRAQHWQDSLRAAGDFSEEEISAALSTTQEEIRSHPELIEQALEGLNVEIDHASANAVRALPCRYTSVGLVCCICVILRLKMRVGCARTAEILRATCTTNA